MRCSANKGNGAIPVCSQCQVLCAVEFTSDVVEGALSRNTVCVDNVHPALILDWWAWKETGELIAELPTLLGYADDSCWTRGQS